MASRPLVAVCTPVYNGEKYLVETMECVQAQTYPNVVHVIVDNASTDSTPEIIERYRNRRVPLLVSRNDATVPIYQNLNRAVNAMPAEADYFCLLCADDLILPEGLEKMAAILDRDPDVGLVAANEIDPKWHGWPEGEVFDGLEAIRHYFYSRLPTAFAHCVFRRRFYDERAPKFYDENLNNTDVDVALAVMGQAKIGYVRDPQVMTREHEATATTREMVRGKIHLAEWLVFLRRYGAGALGPEEAERLDRLYRRFYYRRLLRWRFADRKAELVQRHLDRLDLAEARPAMGDYLDAVIDWPLIKLHLRSRWTLYPQW